MDFKIGAAAVSILLLSGCSNLGVLNKYQPYPLAQWMEAGYLDKLQSAQHWNVLARNEAKLIGESLPKGALVAFDAVEEDSSFGIAYRKLLTQHLVSQGLKVATSPSVAGNLAYLIDYEVQVVKHRDRDSSRWPAGVFSATAASAWLITRAANNWTHPSMVAIPLAAAGDAYMALNRDASTPNTEVLITTNIHRGGVIRQSSTRIYYFNEGDADLYKTSVKKSTLRITDKP